jgi:hypothetical protein
MEEIKLVIELVRDLGGDARWVLFAYFTAKVLSVALYVSPLILLVWLAARTITSVVATRAGRAILPLAAAVGCTSDQLHQNMDKVLAFISEARSKICVPTNRYNRNIQTWDDWSWKKDC